MAVFLRRALSSRNLSILRSSHLSRSLCPSVFPPTTADFASPALPDLPICDSIRNSRRGYAKGKKSKDPSEGSDVDIPEDFEGNVKSTAKSQMDSAVMALSRELGKLRTGRASAGMLDHILVPVGGVKTPINRLAAISVLDSATLSIIPFSQDSLKDIENAIISSPLGLTPKDDGHRLIASVPPLTKEHVQAMCKVISKSSEDVKQSIRRSRQKALEMMKKVSSHFPKDHVKRFEKEIDETMKKFVKSAEDMCKAKEKELN